MTTDRLPLLKELRDRVAKATGPDRDLDAALLTTLSGYIDVFDSRLFRDRDGWYWTASEEDETNPPLPSPTGSLDAAKTLVPKDHWWFGGSGRCTEDEPLYAVTFSLARLGNTIPATEAEHNASIELCFCLARLNYEIATAEATEKAAGIA